MKIVTVAVAALSLFACSFLQAADKSEELKAEVKEAIGQFEKSDSGLKKFFEESSGYVVFPKVAKGAVGVGAAKGTGILFEKGAGIGEASLTQVTIGLQLGGQVYSEVIFFENQAALDNFKAGKFEMSAQVSAVAAAEGAAFNAKYRQGIAVFTLAQGGLMYEASVGGQKFKFKPYKKEKD